MDISTFNGRQLGELSDSELNELLEAQLEKNDTGVELTPDEYEAVRQQIKIELLARSMGMTTKKGT